MWLRSCRSCSEPVCTDRWGMMLRGTCRSRPVLRHQEYSPNRVAFYWVGRMERIVHVPR